MKKLAAVLLLVLFVASCGKQSTEPGGGGVSISNPLPLAVGNTWIYLNYTTGGKPDTTRDTLRIVGTGVVNGHNAYKFISSEEPTDTSYLYRDGDYIYIAQRDGSPDYHIMKFLKVPMVQGDAWTIYSESDSTYSFELKALVKGSADITVPAGEFNQSAEMEMMGIYTYNWNGTTYAETSYSYYYFANDVGIVKIRDIQQNSEEVSDLEDYDLR